ncbi:MAG TPA: tetratricopeptide repeat protein [Solirubrobacteraceae bacterium]|jgi:putative thioredoxin|nr:tetratricopeptide repeat protein [Solirubrobacteraceae bacterium]
MTVIDVTDATFAQEVVERSRQVPVVVDFWAEWCGPCRQLGPLIEREATARGGQVVLAKLDTDANQRTAMEYRIQGIPAVKAFKDGEVVDEFVGAQPPPVVARFFDRLVPSEAERLVAAGDEASLRRALELEPGRPDASLRLARLLVARGERDAALALVERVRGDFQAEGLAARIRLEQRGEPNLEEAWSALDAGDHERAIDLLIAALPNADGARDDIRQAVVAVLDELGVEHPLARDARRRLAAALY